MTEEQRIAELREHARKVASTAPPLTPEKQLRLAALLRPDLPVGINTANTDTGAPRCSRKAAT